MRVALTVYDTNGALEITSVDCSSLADGCQQLSEALNSVLMDLRLLEFRSTVDYGPGPQTDIKVAIERFGNLEDLPTVVSC